MEFSDYQESLSYDICDGCGGPAALNDIHIIKDLAMDGTEYHVCRYCAIVFAKHPERYEVVAATSIKSSKKRPFYIPPERLDPYDWDEDEQVPIIVADNLDKLYDMPSDAVLDEYIDSNPNLFTFQATYSPEEQEVLALANWAEMRSEPKGG